jgi:NADH-quinone oxidoreductase subunit L
VSALIHAATMVTAGVYLVARCAPLFALASQAQLIVAWIGGITALLAAFLAVGQFDLKRVLAYSTVSQLGFMFMALGTLGAVSPVFAVTAAMFHLFTHAFFKALLFLAAGSVMHAMGDVIDMRRFGGLRRVMPITHITFLCGAAALAGIPHLSGFWSKDLIMESLQQAAEGRHAHAGSFYFLLLVALITAGLTAFYTFRAYFLTFHGETRIPAEAGDHAHESPGTMTVPLVVLAIGALFVGVVAEPFTHWFSHFLGRAPSLRLAGTLTGVAEAAHHFNWGIAGLSTLLAFGGIGLAYWLHGLGNQEPEVAPLESVYALSRKKLYVDEIFGAVIVAPAETLAFLARVFDLFLDSLARLLATIPRFLGSWVRPIQNGLVQFYALSMALGLGVFLMFVVFRITRQ